MISQIESNARGLDDLSHKVGSTHLTSLGEREQAARARDGQLTGICTSGVREDKESLKMASDKNYENLCIGIVGQL